MKETDGMDPLVRDHEAFIAELNRVCPEAVSGLAIAGPPPPMLSLRERVNLLRTLPDNAGIDAFMRAWYARGEATQDGRAAADDRGVRVRE
jgi:hypothetical protein